MLNMFNSIKKHYNVIKNKKAFTLTELIAVIVILSILITLSVVVFMNIRRNTLEKEYTNLVSYLEAKAALYAKDTNITTISVEDLIKEGYIKPDDQSDIYDPRDNTSMNCYTLKMEYKDGEYVAKLSDDLKRDENGTCKEYTKTSGYEICRIVGSNCNEIKDGKWFNKNIKLGIKDANGLINRVDVSYSWSTNTGFTSNDKNVTTKVNLIGDITYKCELKMKDDNGKDIVGVATKNVKIDRENPVISEIKYDTNWSLSKTIEVIATDGMGSGIKGYAIVKEDQDCSKYKAKNTVDINSNGNYKVCVKDKAGNITEEIIEVTSIDVVPGNPVISASDGITSGNFHEQDYTLSWKSDYDGTQNLIYYYGTNKNNLTSKGISSVAKKNQYNVTMYVKACTSESNLCSEISSYLINIDTTPTNPVISASDGIASGNFHNSDYTLSWKSTNKGSQDLIYYYGTDKNNLTSKGASVVAKKSQYNVTMYVKACTNGSNLCSGISSYVINVDTTPSNPVISASDGLASGNFHNSDYTLSWKSTNKGSQDLIYYYGTDKNNLTSKGTSVVAKKSQYNVTMYVKACTNGSNLCSGISGYVINVDTTPTNPVISASDGLASGKYHSSNYTLSWKSTNKGSQNLTYYYGTNASKMTSTGTSMSVNMNQYGVYVYVKACTAYNKCSGISKYLLNLDTVAPVIKITSSNDGRNYFKFTATITDSQSGIVAYAITGYETPQNWISVSNTKSLNVSRDISWKEFGTYYIFAKDAMGNESKVERFLVVDRDYPNIVDHEVFYDCSTGKMYVGSRILASASQYTWYYTSTNKNKPSLNASGWSLGCTDISKYNGTCSGSRISLNCYGDTYVWAKACNSYNECTITPIGHAVCSNRQNTGGITYDSNMGHCYNGWITYDINTDKYSCIDRWSHAQNIADKNLEVPCAENGWARKFVPVSGTNYCCPEGFYINKNYKMGNYYACENNYGAPDCFSGAKLSANNGYCTK